MLPWRATFTIYTAFTSTFQIINSDFYKYQEIATMNISAMSIHLCMQYTIVVRIYGLVAFFNFSCDIKLF
jgi:hypothetical protein